MAGIHFSISDKCDYNFSDGLVQKSKPNMKFSLSNRQPFCMTNVPNQISRKVVSKLVLTNSTNNEFFSTNFKNQNWFQVTEFSVVWNQFRLLSLNPKTLLLKLTSFIVCMCKNNFRACLFSSSSFCKSQMKQPSGMTLRHLSVKKG